MRIAFLMAHEGVEQIEFTRPWEALSQTGETPQVISTRPGSVQAFNHLDKAGTFPVDQTAAEASPDDFDALVLPGGVANPDALRMDADAVAFARSFFEAGKPVAAICHAPWLLVEARVVAGRTLTSWPSLATDIRNAGGIWVDEEVCVDRHLVTSRKPGDLPAFIARSMELFARSLADRGPAREVWRRAVARDEVEEASRESFPASDSPPWT